MKLYLATSNIGKILSPSDWKNAQGFVEIMKPFHCATKIEEGETYLTLALVIPVLSILHEKTTAYEKNRQHRGYGILFARNVLASLEDKFGKYPNFMLMQPHALATFSNPRFSKVYFSNGSTDSGKYVSIII